MGKIFIFFIFFILPPQLSHQMFFQIAFTGKNKKAGPPTRANYYFFQNKYSFINSSISPSITASIFPVLYPVRSSRTS